MHIDYVIYGYFRNRKTATSTKNKVKFELLTDAIIFFYIFPTYATWGLLGVGCTLGLRTK